MTAGLPGKIQLRPTVPEDAGKVVRLINTCSAITLGSPQAVVDGAGAVRTARYVSPTAARVVAEDEDGRVVGFAYCVPLEHPVIFEMGGWVTPDRRGIGIGSLLRKLAEQKAGERSQGAAAGVRVVLQTNLAENDRSAINFFHASGYQKMREWLHMEVNLSEPPVIAVPEGFTIRAMNLENDWDLAEPAMTAAFAQHWGAIVEPLSDEAIQEDEEEIPEDESFSNASGFCFLAMAGGEAAGGILCNRKLVDRADTGRVGSLFVRPEYQRQGLGRALMLTATRAFWQDGIRRIVTDTDAASFSQTPKFYASLGMKPTRREFLYEKEIRPGREVRRLSA